MFYSFLRWSFITSTTSAFVNLYIYILVKYSHLNLSTCRLAFETLYSSWLLHILFVYLIVFVLFKTVISCSSNT